MADNKELLQGLLTKVTRPLDLGGYDRSLEGQTFTVWVNAPRVVELVRTDAQGYENERKTVAILFEVPLEQVQNLDDALVLWLYAEGVSLYNEYHDALKKK